MIEPPREYGSTGPLVVVLHGGPGAPGHMAPVAHELATSCRVVEPMQRHSESVPLTVDRHVADLHQMITQVGSGRPVLVGSSWGAMLALAYAARHPDAAGPLVLIGCGTFDRAARRQMEATIAAHMSPTCTAELDRLAQIEHDPDARLAGQAKALEPLYLHDPLPHAPGDELWIDARGHRETWADMLRLQAAGVYPAAFAAIRSPVLMLHGRFDPHPGPRIRDSLLAQLPQLTYHEWANCGHYPWRERHVRADFFQVLRRWIDEQVAAAGAT